MPLIEKDCSGVPPPVSVSFFTTAISIVLIFFTVPPNFLICWTVFKGRQTLLRNAFSCLVVNLAFADLVIGVVVLTISTYVHFLEGITNHPNLPVLPVGRVFHFICCSASTLSVATMAGDRYLAVVHPVIYRNRIRPRQAFLASLCIWFISIVLPVALYFQVGFFKYAFIFANTAIISTLTIHLFSHISMYLKLHSRFKESSERQSRCNSENNQRQTLEKEKRLVMTFVIIVLAYLICYMPSCVIIYVLNFCGQSCSCTTVHWLRDLQYVLTWINSSVNPFIYSWRIPSFKIALLGYLPGFGERRRVGANQVAPTTGITKYT